MAEAASLQQRAYDRIREMIVLAKLEPGHRISIKDLCDQLGMGRTPVRESLVRLAQDGLVYARPQSGTYVSPIDLHAAESARFVRENLEMEVAVRCCAHIDEEGVELLDRLLAEQEQASRHGDDLDFFVGDDRFHQALFEIAGHGEVWGWLASISTDLNRFRRLSIIVEGLDGRVVLNQHYGLRDAILAHNTGEARYLASVHLHKMLADEQRVIDRFPGYFAEVG